VVTDGGPDETGYLASIDPKTWERKTLLNNYYERPFIGFNEIEMDREGNYYLTDSLSGWVCTFFDDIRGSTRAIEHLTDQFYHRGVISNHSMRLPSLQFISSTPPP
jgi:hypothetical protein